MIQHVWLVLQVLRFICSATVGLRTSQTLVHNTCSLALHCVQGYNQSEGRRIYGLRKLLFGLVSFLHSFHSKWVDAGTKSSVTLAISYYTNHNVCFSLQVRVARVEI